ncbi:CLUMA_CG015763, isoform A [Clunio marinus]|uniref:CLUMA_CG015763, isoform A n=1 Tax=Clunio marinus TaxID=568069 RepID=A0A1J1IT84_9DIPT|nr:CLUMA_CG015763, isoform A [Clunio marinus]
MSNKSEFKENSGKKTANNSAKRLKMNESASFSKTYSEFEDDKDASVSVTIYEDDNDLNYFNKSKSRILNSSFGKRSPLVLINKTNQSAAGSSSQHQIPIRTSCKVDEAFVKRHQLKEPATDPFQSISDEILLHIFSFLPKKTLNRIATVNDRFSRVIQDETLWIRLDLGYRLLRRGAISKIISRGVIILRLAQAKIQSPIFESYFDSDEFVSTKLQYLDLSMASIDTSSLEQFIKTCRSLKKLSLEAVPLDYGVCRQIAANKNLEVLNLAMCEGITKQGMICLLINLQNLLALNISWTGLNRECVAAVVEKLTPTIVRLNISGCRKSLLDSHIQTLTRRCRNLVELDISDCTLLTSNCIENLMSLDKLEYISLSRCYNIATSSYL